MSYEQCSHRLAMRQSGAWPGRHPLACHRLPPRHRRLDRCHPGQAPSSPGQAGPMPQLEVTMNNACAAKRIQRSTPQVMQERRFSRDSSPGGPACSMPSLFRYTNTSENRRSICFASPRVRARYGHNSETPTEHADLRVSSPGAASSGQPSFVTSCAISVCVMPVSLAATTK